MWPGALPFRRSGRRSTHAESARLAFGRVVEPLESRRLLSAAPLAPNLFPETDSGVSNSDDITRFDNALPSTAPRFAVGGTKAGAAVSLYVDGVLAQTATASGASVSVTLDGTTKLSEGVHQVTARQTEAGGTESDPSPALALTIDVTAPAAPPPLDLQPASDTGVSNSDNITGDNTPTFDVSAGPYFRVERDGGLVSGLYESGQTYTTSPLTNGASQFTVRAVDAAGNVSPRPAPLPVTIDSIGPNAALDAPLATPAKGDTAYRFSVAYTDAVGVDLASIDNQDVRFTGPNGYNQPAVLESVTSDANGTRRVATYRAPAPGGAWDYTDNGVYSVDLQASQVRDVAGNFRSPGVLGSVTVRFFGPTGMPDLSGFSDSGASASDNVTNFDNSSAQRKLEFTVSKTYPGALVTVYADGTPLGSAVATSTATAVVTSGDLPLPSGYYAITARQTLAGEDPVADSPALGLTIDTIAPAVPAGPDLQAASDSGVSNADDLTNDTTPTFDLPLILGSYYDATVDGEVVVSRAPAAPAFTSAPLADGPHTITVRAGDVAGNFSESSAPLLFTIDTVAPGKTFYAGTLDGTFDGDGVLSSADDAWSSAAVLPDGKVLLAGAKGVTRLNPDGTRDASFGSNGTVAVGGPIAQLQLQPDGHIVLAGPGTVRRLSATGVLDTAFAGTGSAAVDFTLRKMAVAPDGKVLLAGSPDGIDRITVARLNADGTPDVTFGTNGKVVVPSSADIPNAYPLAVAGTPDGRVLVAGFSYVPVGGGDFRNQTVVFRFNADGTPDATFNGNGRLLLRLLAGSEAQTIEALPGGKILLSGEAATPGAPETNVGYVARLTPTGALDTTFDGDGVQTSLGFKGFGGTLSDGSVFLATSAFGGVGFVRYGADGRPVPEPGGMNVSAILPTQGFSPSSVAIGPDDKLVVVGVGVGVFPPTAVARLGTGTLGVLDLQAASDSGSSSTDDVTNDTAPTLDLVAPPTESGVYLRLYRNGVRVGGAFEGSSTYTSEPLADGVWRFTTVMADAAGNEAFGATLPVTVDTTPPKLQTVWAYGTVWKDPFFDALNKSGVGNGVDGAALPTTAATIPWGMINRLTLILNEPTHIGRDDVQFVATPGPAPVVTDFQPVGLGTGGIWTFAGNLPQGRLVLTFADKLADAAGNHVAGAGGGPYQYPLNVLIGDGDRDGRVGPRDLAQVRARLGSAGAAPGSGARGYSPWYDFNADGKINATDYRIARFRQLSTLSPAPVAAQAAAPVRSAYSPVRVGVLVDERTALPA